MDLPTPDENGIIFREAALIHGMTDDELHRAAAGGTLKSLAPGCYVLATADRYPEDEHRLTAIATATKFGDSAGVVSHQSAACVHRLGMLGPNLSRVHFTVAGDHGNVRRLRGLIA